jgi:glutamyl-tRNA reductase|tara:strand:+ start:179 stop:448 length:270 start_codon:yes stop_codon:yes gene_type:complete
VSSLFNTPEPERKARVKYRTIRVREEVAKELDEWRDLFEDASISEVIWRVFALARRELKRVRDKKRKAREKFTKIREEKKQIVNKLTNL